MVEIDKLEADIRHQISEEVEKRVVEWLRATHGVNFTEFLKRTQATNALLRDHNRRFYHVLKKCYEFLDEFEKTAGYEDESPLHAEVRELIQSVQKRQTVQRSDEILKDRP